MIADKIQQTIEDYICRENLWQIAKIDYLFSVNFHGSIFFAFWLYVLKIYVLKHIYIKAKEIND